MRRSVDTEILPPSQQAEEEVKENNELPIHDEKPALPSNGSDAGSKKTDIKWLRLQIIIIIVFYTTRFY